MINYKVKYSKEFKKSLKKVIKQGKNIDKLLDVVDILSQKQQLDSKYKDHVLYNDKRFKDCRDCHIESDWVLIYKYLENEIVLLLVNTGSHSDVLDK
ncbi:MAG: type II toxin-antitoxin system YafQ family toxin [Bacilli bacterium]|nr:type II toxin-antitoxin system YafQ family toxin [Bacilli bacterium]